MDNGTLAVACGLAAVLAHGRERLRPSLGMFAKGGGGRGLEGAGCSRGQPHKSHANLRLFSALWQICHVVYCMLWGKYKHFLVHKGQTLTMLKVYYRFDILSPSRFEAS